MESVFGFIHHPCSTHQPLTCCFEQWPLAQKIHNSGPTSNHDHNANSRCLIIGRNSVMKSTLETIQLFLFLKTSKVSIWVPPEFSIKKCTFSFQENTVKYNFLQMLMLLDTSDGHYHMGHIFVWKQIVGRIRYVLCWKSLPAHNSRVVSSVLWQPIVSLAEVVQNLPRSVVWVRR